MRSSSAITMLASSMSCCSTVSIARPSGLRDQVEPAQGLLLEPFELVLELGAGGVGHQPTLPVT